MNDSSQGNFDDLLDPDFQDHVIEVIKQLCTGNYSSHSASFADLLEADISKPAKAWINEAQQKRKEGNYSDIEAAEAFAIRADNIVYILRYKTRLLYPEHVALLNDAWSEFQRSIAYHLHIETRILGDHIRNLPDPQKLADEVLQQRRDDELKKKEARKRAHIKEIQAKGAKGARISRHNRNEVLLMSAKKIIKEKRKDGKLHEIQSVSGFARAILDDLKKSSYGYTTSNGKERTLQKKHSSIRKMEEIIKLHRKEFGENKESHKK